MRVPNHRLSFIFGSLSIIWLAFVIALGWKSRKSSIFFVHPTTVYYHSGPRVWACDGMLVIVLVRFDNPGPRMMLRCLADVQGDLATNSRWRSESPVLDSYYSDPRNRWLTTPRFTIPRASISNGGGFFAYSLSMSPPRIRVDILTTPLWLIGTAPRLVWLAIFLRWWAKQRHLAKQFGFEVIRNSVE